MAQQIKALIFKGDIVGIDGVFTSRAAYKCGAGQ
jgi:hypothetical protein